MVADLWVILQIKLVAARNACCYYRWAGKVKAMLLHDLCWLVMVLEASLMTL